MILNLPGFKNLEGFFTIKKLVTPSLPDILDLLSQPIFVLPMSSAFFGADFLKYLILH
jgi:hypothetical protein